MDVHMDGMILSHLSVELTKKIFISYYHCLLVVVTYKIKKKKLSLVEDNTTVYLHVYYNLKCINPGTF